jgi:hypothetical protein
MKLKIPSPAVTVESSKRLCKKSLCSGAESGRTVIRVNLKGDEEKPSLVVKIERSY